MSVREKKLTLSTPILVDKSSSAELTESINSMFQWYKSAQVCYAFLEDLIPGHEPEDMMQNCRWFSRGWTLQELIAPPVLKFFNKSWDFIGTKADYARSISRFTKIHERALLGARELSSFCIAQRMAWAAGRQTKRQEDVAYCLLGIFDVNMPLIYGEGRKAFRRLQEEIVKRDNDFTILFWRCLQDSYQKFIGCFAPSPANFADKHNVVASSNSLGEFSTTNKGLSLSTKVSLQLVNIQRTGGSLRTVYFMPLGIDPTGRSLMHGIFLRKLAPHFYCRLAENNLEILRRTYGRQDIRNSHIVMDSRVALSKAFASCRKMTLSVQPSEKVNIISAFPTAYWDHTGNMFLDNGYSLDLSNIALLLELEILVKTDYIPVKLLCYRRKPFLGFDLGVLDDGCPFNQSHLIYADRYQESGVPWDVIGYDKTKKWPLRNELTVKTKNGFFWLSFGTKVDHITSVWGQIQTQRLVVSVVRMGETS
ncbi:uncharacterized protein yc1106_01846 [Curvularia clavata]|uniref:Uncharacterized protein n=1 Tax=Curvularia clavata TaxID=95742 RepID=A0A9Q9DPI5_CURCL|nr:uncharacterized protein yc1106_01846 [Curvularia clavata]